MNSSLSKDILDFKSEDFLYIVFKYGIPENIISVTTRFDKVYEWDIAYQTKLPKVIKREPYSLTQWDSLIQSAYSIKIEDVYIDASDYESSSDLDRHFNELDKEYIKAFKDSVAESRTIIKESLSKCDPIKNIDTWISIVSES